MNAIFFQSDIFPYTSQIGVFLHGCVVSYTIHDRTKQHVLLFDSSWMFWADLGRKFIGS